MISARSAPGRDSQASAEGAGQTETAVPFFQDDRCAYSAAFAAADIAQGGHDLADEGMISFGAAVAVGLKVRRIIHVRLVQPPVSFHILHNSRIP